MMITKMALPRRTFLRGMGVTLALPLLDAMVPALSAAANAVASPVSRLGFIMVPHGAPMKPWTPAGNTGPLTELSPTLAPLEKFREQLVVLTNFEHREAEGVGVHLLANSTFLSATKAKRTDGTDVFLGTTVDQVAAQAFGRETPLPSLELGIDMTYTLGACDNGYNCLYQNVLSWSSPTTPLAPEPNPRVIFERLFGDGGTAAERLAAARTDKSILDWMRGDLSHLHRKLGPSDRTRVNEYLDSVREIERRIQRSEQQTEEQVLPVDLERPVGAPASWDEHVKLMFDLQVLALQADLTRVISFQMSREITTRSFPQCGVTDPWHPLSHHQDDPEKLAKLARINTYHVSLLAYLLEKLRSTPDGDGTLLDNTAYLYGSGMGNSQLHDHRNLPMLVVGGSGKLKGGRHIRMQEPTPVANIFLSLLDKYDVNRESFGDSTGRVSEL